MDVFRNPETDDLEAPLYPARTVLLHVATKSLQLGSALGLACSPLVALYSRRSIGEAIRISVNRSSLVLVVLTSGVMAARTYSGHFDGMSVDDRAYRIVHNKGQRQLDAWSAQAACGGLVFGALAGYSSPGILAAFTLSGVALSAYAFATKKFLATPSGQRVSDRVSGELAKLVGTSQN